MKKYIVLVIVLFTVAIIFFVIKYGAPSYPENYEEVIITLDRTVCYGSCPSYSLIIYGNGSVVYNGRDFVEVEGVKVYEISKENVAEIVDAFYKADYFSLRNKYTQPVTDLPTTITSITVDGKKKQVVDYHGAPEKLKELEKKIDELAHTAKLIGNKGR